MRGGCDIFIYVCYNYAVNWKIEKPKNGLKIRVGVDFAGLLAPRGFFQSFSLFFGGVSEFRRDFSCVYRVDHRLVNRERIKILFIAKDGV